MGIRSFYGRVVAANGQVLIGGVKVNESSRFASREAAESWLLAVLTDNRNAGRIPTICDPAFGDVHGSRKAPEINE